MCVCRLYDVICCTSPDYITTAVGQEHLLLQTYKVKLPAAHRREPTIIPGSRDLVATSILNNLQPSLLHQHIPLAVYGDGNCMFRAVSRVMYGTENQHALLRLLEIASTLGHTTVHVLITRTLSVTPPSPYAETLQIASKLGCSTEIIHLHASCQFRHRRANRVCSPIAEQPYCCVEQGVNPVTANCRRLRC